MGLILCIVEWFDHLLNRLSNTGGDGGVVNFIRATNIIRFLKDRVIQTQRVLVRKVYNSLNFDVCLSPFVIVRVH